MFRILLLCLLIFAGGTCAVPTSLFAGTAPGELSELQLRIDVAGRQRMLSQRMVRAACNAHLDLNRDQILSYSPSLGQFPA